MNQLLGSRHGKAFGDSKMRQAFDAHDSGYNKKPSGKLNEKVGLISAPQGEQKSPSGCPFASRKKVPDEQIFIVGLFGVPDLFSAG
jgi:hypothetical protein